MSHDNPSEFEKKVGEMFKGCLACGNSTKDLRFGHCFQCAEAESIILEGVDMYEKGLDGGSEPAKTGMEKVKLLHQKGIIK